MTTNKRNYIITDNSRVSLSLLTSCHKYHIYISPEPLSTVELNTVKTTYISSLKNGRCAARIKHYLLNLLSLFMFISRAFGNQSVVFGGYYLQSKHDFAGFV